MRASDGTRGQESGLRILFKHLDVQAVRQLNRWTLAGSNAEVSFVAASCGSLGSVSEDTNIVVCSGGEDASQKLLFIDLLLGATLKLVLSHPLA